MRIVIGEDETLLREGLALLLERVGFVVVAVAADGPGLVQAAATHRPDVVITDIRMPPTYTDEGIRIAAEFREDHPDMGVVVLSDRTVEAHVRHVLLKLDIPESEEGNRRVLAVLTHLREVHDWS